MTIPTSIIHADAEIELAMQALSDALEKRAKAISDAISSRQITWRQSSKLRDRSHYNSSLRAFNLEEHFDLPAYKGTTIQSLLEWDRGI
jgi:hypothetical protein